MNFSKRNHFFHSMLLGLLALAVVTAFSPSVLAQSQAGTGQIVGTVTDPTGAVIPGATVTATNKNTNSSHDTTTNEMGQYRLILLPPGPYVVKVETTGFKTTEVSLELRVGAAPTVNVEVQIGATAETVEVTATTLIDTTRSESDTVFSVESIDNLPINGRRFADFITLTPTVQVEPQRGTISFSGQRGINSFTAIDGADNGNPFFGATRGGERTNEAFSVPQESIEEFQVVASGFSAEFGRSTGGVLNAITRSGTNNWNGSIFYFLRNQSLGTEDAEGNEAITERTQLGGRIGGPIVADKSFFFLAAETQINDQPRQVVYSSLASFTPIAEQQEAFDFYKSLEEPFTQTNDATAILVRLDHNINDAHRLTLRYNWSENEALNAVATGNQISPETNLALSTNGTEGDNTNIILGRVTSTLSPTMVNEARVLYSREERPRTPNSQQPIVHTSIGRFGTRSFLPTTEFDTRTQFADNFTWNTGAHSIKFGGEFNSVVADQLFGFNQFGRAFVFSSTGGVLDLLSAQVGAGANRFDADFIDYLLQIGNLQARMEMSEAAFYVTDAWRVNPNITLTLGFRWEGYFNPTPASTNTALTDLVRNTTFPLGSVDPSTIGDNTDQWMPRIGLAWDPDGDGKTVVRAAAGVYYARTPLLLMADPINNFRAVPGNLSVTLPFTNGIGCDTVYCQFLLAGIDLNTFTLNNLPTLTPADLAAIATGLGIAPDPFNGANVTAWADDYESPRSVHLTAGVEREIASGLKIGVDLALLNTVHLQRNRNLNQAPPTGAGADGRPQFNTSLRPLPTLGDVSIRESSARSVYSAVTYNAEYNKGRYMFQAFYTLSNNQSDDDNERSAGGFTYDNGFDLRREFGASELHTRHQFRFSSVVNLPYDVVISGSTFARSGRPINPRVGSDVNGDRDGVDRAYVAVGVPFRRNSFRNEPFYETNFRVAKRFPFGEKMRLDVTFDLFNVFNHDNIQIAGNNTRYGRGIDTAGNFVAPECFSFRCFGRLRLADGSVDPNNNVGAPFQAQFGVRFTF